MVTGSAATAGAVRAVARTAAQKKDRGMESSCRFDARVRTLGSSHDRAIALLLRPRDFARGPFAGAKAARRIVHERGPDRAVAGRAKPAWAIRSRFGQTWILRE